MPILRETESIDILQAIICEGTNNNTGKNNGILRKIEELLGRPLQWLVCHLHMKELPFKKRFPYFFGGQTT